MLKFLGGGAMFIQGGMAIPESRVEKNSKFCKSNVFKNTGSTRPEVFKKMTDIILIRKKKSFLRNIVQKYRKP